MARPKKTNAQLIKEYGTVIAEINSGTPYRKIARTYGIGLSTVQRLANRGLYVVRMPTQCPSGQPLAGTSR